MNIKSTSEEEKEKKYSDERNRVTYAEPHSGKPISGFHSPCCLITLCQ